MADVGEDVLRGRSPVWRELWEERLDDVARRRVRSAVASGRQVSDPLEAALAVGLAWQRRRAAQFQLCVLLPVYLALALFWLWATCRPGQAEWLCATWILIAAVVVTVVPTVAVRRFVRAGRADAANRAVLDDAAE